MKSPLGKFRISRKLVLIIGGVVVLCGGTGAAAVFIGTETLLGPSYKTLNGLACTEVKTVKIHKADRFWIRKYVTTEPTDGMSRVKTALRVATAVYAIDTPDLVQVVVLDKKGPEDRSDMRGRAVGADVIFIADPSKVPEEGGAAVYTARYVDKPANEFGQFYGEKINIPIDEIEQLVAKLDDKTECEKLEAPAGSGHGAPAGHGAAAPSAHGEAPAADGHGAPAADGHGEVPVAEGHGEAPVADGHGAPAAVDEHGQPIPDAAVPASGGWFASLKGMVLGAPAAPAAEAGHDAPAGHDAASPAGHDAPAAPAAEASHDAPAGSDAPVSHDTAEPAVHDAPAGHETAAPAAHGEAPVGEGHAAPVAEAHPQASAPGEEASAAAHQPAVPETEAAASGSWFSSLKGMVMGAPEAPEAPAAAVEAHDAVPAEDAAQLPVAHDAATPDAAPMPAAAAKTSDDFGNAWLAKLRATPVAGAKAKPATGSDAAADDEGVLPPKTVVPKPDVRAAPTR
ncbi:MAG: hypothetical protein ACOH2J_05215 [Allorhizobium sp.]